VHLIHVLLTHHNQLHLLCLTEFANEHKSSHIMCGACHKPFGNIGSMELHQCVHTGERPYCCDVYNKIFSNKMNLKVRLHVHNGERPYDC
jgi:hypothetical protein